MAELLIHVKQTIVSLKEGDLHAPRPPRSQVTGQFARDIPSFSCGSAALGSLPLNQKPMAQPPLRGSDPPMKTPDSG
jgi:hypothetical protein